jgi:hypothetical protein
LYHGANSENDYKYFWQKKNDDSIERDPNKACSQVTVDACTKLKNTFGENLRIYLIAYRRQNSYKPKISGDAVAFDYSYLNNCASGTGKPYIYDVSNEAALKSALDTIAEDIKSFAGHKNAENVN